MKHRIQLILASLLCLGIVAVATADPPQKYGGRPPAPQREENVPNWAVGSWAGNNDFIRADITLDIDRNGRASMAQKFRDTTKNLRGNYRLGRLEFGRDRYIIRQDGRDLTLTSEADSRDSVKLRRADRDAPDRWNGRNELTIDSPRNNDRVRSGIVTFQGSTNYEDVRIEIRRGAESVRKLTASARGGGHFEARADLRPGRYEVRFSVGDRNRNMERSIVLNVGGMGRVHIDTPSAGEKLRQGSVNITGTSESDEVEVEIYRGRERVFIERVHVRDDRFTSKPSLAWGSYILTVRSMEAGTAIGTDKRGFEIVETSAPTDLRLERPSNNGRYRGNVDFDGSAGGGQVIIQIYRGRDRVYNQTVTVRDGHFHTRAALERGHYEATVSLEDRGRSRTERRVSFDVD
jgi:hypothetical protein